MRYSTPGMILAAMTFGEAMAGPAHAHMHRHAHQKKDVDWNAIDWNALGIDWSSAWAAGQHTSTSAAPAPTSTAPAATTTTAAAAPAQTSAASTTADKLEGVFNEVAELFGGLVGAANTRDGFGGVVAASGAQGDSYMGNYGAPYCSNMYPLPDLTIPSNVSYSNTFFNNQSSYITLNIWNKVGPDLQPLSGSSLAPKSTCLTLVIQSGHSVAVAFDVNSEVAWAQAVDSYIPSGAYRTGWGEAQLGSSTGSAYDLSSINDNLNYNMVIEAANVDCTSSLWSNSWKTASYYLGTSGGSCYVPAGNPVHMTTTMGGNLS